MADDRDEVGLTFLKAGEDFADGVIAYEETQLWAEVFLSFDTDAVALVRTRQVSAALS